MSIIEERLSTTVVPDTFLVPDGDNRLSWTYDRERGPVGLSDVSKGVVYQNWTLTYDDIAGDLIVTPETVGSPSIIRTGLLGIQQCTFTFDMNGRVSCAYTQNNRGYLYWYDTAEEGFVTDTLDIDVIWPSITLDDKRAIHSDRNDMILYYTRDMGDLTYNLYYRQQRDRFTIERLLGTNVPPRILKFGMHKGLRNQLVLTYALQI